MDRSALERELARLLERHRERPEGRAFAPLADCHRKLGHFDEAKALLRQGLKRHPDYNAARVILGKLHQDTGELEEARVAYGSVLEFDPFNLVARRQLARLCEELGDPAAARGHWEQLAANDPTAEDAVEALERLTVAPATPERQTPPAPRPDVAVLQASLEPDDETEPVEPEADDSESATEAESALKPTLRVSTPEGIVTVTLARIYRAQGFAARALEIYEELQRAAPQPEFSQAIEELRHELGRREPAAARAIDEFAPGKPMEVPLPRPAADEPEPEPAKPVPSVEDFDHFRSWLDRIKVRG